MRPMLRIAALVVLVLAAGVGRLAAQMPDMKQMSGIPRPVTDLPNGSVSIRVIRGDMSNNLANQPVEMRAGDKTQTVNTDAEGRAQFDNLTPGSVVKFSTVVDGERLESQEFPVQPQGGVRMLLVATDPNAKSEPAAPATPAVAGNVALGGESRIVVETNEDTVSIYYIIDLINGASTPVNPPEPFVFSMPTAAIGTTVVQGSSPLASSSGRVVTVVGPFPPGTTTFQVAADLPSSNGVVELTQSFPQALPQVVVIAKKSGNLKLSSPQFERTEEQVIEGTPVVLGFGRGLAANQTMALTISGLPYHSTTGRNVALLLASLIVVGGIWAAMRGGSSPSDEATERAQLIARREKLFQELVRLEHDHQRGRAKAQTLSCREELVRSSRTAMRRARDLRSWA
ncbi:MAG: hypothetical protein U0Q11_21400 [Vicinamibacterales bacterium]